jgi:two-component system, OmpR family, sensor histidine kinase KdpD
MNDNRADSFLRLIRRSQRGRLKIYLGYAAGVGKTYQMLLEARRLREDGVKVMVGVVETHGRVETELLLNGMDAIPRKKIIYRGIEIGEMDLDAILSTSPEVVLIDELAHTNVPGSRNSKRYEDIEEILAAGIHVISTMNVQHLESLYETVEGVTGVKVRERVPDRILAEADQIVNVDITTEDLRRRLQEGKVYTREFAGTALTNFFKPVNLEQLRELTLRELAAHIDSRRRDPSEEEIPSNPDQVMVCLSSGGPKTETLLRYASRLAGRLNRNWYAVYVQSSRENPSVIDATTQRMLSNNLTLAKQLGATVFTYKGEDIVKTILQFAKEYRVGHIILGAPGKKTIFWKTIFGREGVAERLIKEGEGHTIVVLDTRTVAKSDKPVPMKSVYEKSVSDSQIKKSLSVAKESLFSNNSIVLWNKVIDKEDAMRELLNACMQKADKTLKDSAWDSLMMREQEGGTYVGDDIAIPHVRIKALSQPIVALGIGKAGIHDRDSNRDFKIMILLLSPVDPPSIHVEMLSIVSRIARDDQWRREVLAAERPSDVLKLINIGNL